MGDEIGDKSNEGDQNESENSESASSQSEVSWYNNPNNSSLGSEAKSEIATTTDQEGQEPEQVSVENTSPNETESETVQPSEQVPVESTSSNDTELEIAQPSEQAPVESTSPNDTELEPAEPSEQVSVENASSTSTELEPAEPSEQVSVENASSTEAEPVSSQPSEVTPMSREQTVPLDKVRYSQDSVSFETRDGRTIPEVAEDMRTNGWDHSQQPPDMVDWKDGEFQTLDHRRLVAAHEAGLTEVPARIHDYNEPLPASQEGRFIAKRSFTDPDTGKEYLKGEEAQTWGEAAMMRAAGQKDPDFPLRGSVSLPRITKAPNKRLR